MPYMPQLRLDWPEWGPFRMRMAQPRLWRPTRLTMCKWGLRLSWLTLKEKMPLGV